MFDDNKNINKVADTYRQMVNELTMDGAKGRCAGIVPAGWSHGKTAILTHPDEVSGTTILSDGVKIYWTEGRSSRMMVVKPDGSKMWAPVNGGSPEQQAYFDREQQVEEDGADIHREMTPAEEKEWDTARNPGMRWPTKATREGPQ